MQPDDLSRLARLTRTYARYAREAGGLSSTLGGALALVAYFAGAFLAPASLPVRLALASTPFLWLGARGVLRRRLYQPLGRVEAARSPADRRLHATLTGLTALVALAVIGSVSLRTLGTPGHGLDGGTAGYLALVAVLPVVSWRCLHTPLEFVVGVFLVCQAALALAGSHYALGEQPQAPVAAAALLVLGVRQHLEFRRLREELRALGARP